MLNSIILKLDWSGEWRLEEKVLALSRAVRGVSKPYRETIFTAMQWQRIDQTFAYHITPIIVNVKTLVLKEDITQIYVYATGQ